MKRNNFLNLMLGSVLSLSICAPGFASPVTKGDIDQSEEFLRKKAEIRYTKVGGETIREVFINGFRVNDQNLASLVNDKALMSKIGSAVSSRRATWGTTVGLGLPAGSLLIYLAATSRAALPVDNRPVPIGQFNRAPSVDAKTFVLGTLGALVTIYAVVNSVSLLNDITGLNSPSVLKDKEAENIVKTYNEKLKTELFNKQSNNDTNISLSSMNNNIMILNVRKSF
jgi:hypothetical protein